MVKRESVSGFNDNTLYNKEKYKYTQARNEINTTFGKITCRVNLMFTRQPARAKKLRDWKKIKILSAVLCKVQF